MSKNLVNKKNIFYEKVINILETARKNVVNNINHEMVIAYWNIGKEIVEEEQSGSKRAEYGKYVIEELAKQLTKKFGKGFDKSNISRFKKFYLTFKNFDSVRQQLSWTHYRLILKIEKEMICQKG